MENNRLFLDKRVPSPLIGFLLDQGFIYPYFFDSAFKVICNNTGNSS